MSEHHDEHVVVIDEDGKVRFPYTDFESCTWLVRRHDRHLEHQPDHHAVASRPGGPCDVCGTRTARVRAHIKGPEGLPLRAHDILYRLAR